MSQQQKLEQVLDLLLSEDSEKASELLHQIIVEKARGIYESIVTDDEPVIAEEDDVVGGEPSVDFTDEIANDEAEINADEENAGEVDADAEVEDELDVEDRVEDLESQLAELRAEFNALMGEEMLEPNHADLPAEIDAIDAGDVAVDEMSPMWEGANGEKLEVAPQAKKQGNKVAEETKFLNKTPDTGQRGKAGLVGTGKNTPLGAEQDQSSFTKIPPRVDYGGTPKNILGSKATGGEYGKFNGESAKDDTPSDNVKVDPKKSGVKADTTAKYTGGKAAGAGFTKSPLTTQPRRNPAE